MVKLNIGAGSTKIEGYTPLDLKYGNSAAKLEYDDNSVEEIRASHVLEHMSFGDAKNALREWHRVLKPGGKAKIAVPDFERMSTADDNWPFYLMGGQIDDDDFHRSAYNEKWLRSYMHEVGFENIQPWDADNIDTASHQVSLRLEGVKPPPTLQICALMSIPRVGFNDNWGCILEALRPFQIPVHRFTGVFWGQCMQRGLDQCLEEGANWVLCIDYDSMFTSWQLDELMGIFGNEPHIDALTALQSKRNTKFPLATIKGHMTEDTNRLKITGEPFKVTTAHFGLTLLRMECLRTVEKPWFKGEPDSNGEWGDDRMDDDIWFWHQWRKAGHNIYMTPQVRIGHIELVVSEYDEKLEHRQITVGEWRENASKISEAMANSPAVESACDNG